MKNILFIILICFLLQVILCHKQNEKLDEENANDSNDSSDSDDNSQVNSDGEQNNSSKSKFTEQHSSDDEHNPFKIKIPKFEEPEKEGAKGLKSMIEKMYEYAKELEDTYVDPYIDKVKSGNVPNYFPQADAVQNTTPAQRKLKRDLLLDKFFQPQKICMYPNSEENAMTFCDQQFQLKGEERVLDCKNMMCINCCDHLLLMYQELAKDSNVAKALDLTDDAGAYKMAEYLTEDVILQCRHDCQNIYPNPIFEISLPDEDPDLGKSFDQPANSCVDVLKYGKSQESDVYYIQKADKPPQQVYCDMKTDEGGWMLIYSYSHDPEENYEINDEEIPIDPQNGKSHIILREHGFSDHDVKEIRFECTTTNDGKYMHFKTDNPEIIHAALTGEINGIKSRDWKKDTINLSAPEGGSKQSLAFDSINQLSQNEAGGFWDTPFRSKSQGAWTIKGSSDQPKWECGDNLQESEGTKFQTKHTIWVKAYPPTEDQLRQRAIRYKIKDHHKKNDSNSDESD